MKHKDAVYDGLARQYKQVVSNIVTSNAELKRIGQNFIEFGKDIINSREALSFDKESIDVSRIMALIEKHDVLIGKRQDTEKQLVEFGPLPKL